MNSASTEPVTVLLVDDHAVVREGYRRLLERSSSIRVIGEAADAQSAYLQYLQHRPQVMVMDIALPGASGIEALRRIRARDPQANILMFSMYEDAVFASRALQAGARGYVTKASAPDVLVEAVLTVARGKSFLSAGIAQDLALRGVEATADAASELSPREFEVLRLLVQGASVTEIARQLGLTPKTVANHQSSIRQKLDADSAVKLLQVATRMGLIGESGVMR
jgi:two-component system, NarL family, invasion response regulator UvrY